MRKIASVLAGLILMGTGIQAQKITGVVKDQQGKGLDKATVSLHRAKDSSVVKLGATNSGGQYSFITSEGQYLVSASFVGYATTYSPVFDGGKDISVPAITMATASASIAAVTVSATRPLIEVRADKTIVNVEGTINAIGNDALELLRKSPGVTVDKDDNISLAGKSGVQVFIDGKPSPLAGPDLANYLKTTQSSQIESIEIITNPSAKYEAAGNAGIINIRLKKNKSFGTNGGMNGGYTQGFYAKYNGGFNFNHRNKKINVFGNYNYNNGKYRMQFDLEKHQFDTLFEQHNTMVFKNNTHGFKGGIDYFINAKSTLGAVVNGNIANNQFTTQGAMHFTYEPSDQLVKILDAANNNVMDRDNVNANLNYRYAVSGGTELNIDADYGFYKIASNQFQPNIYYMPDWHTEINRVVNRMISPTDINLYSVKADYEKNVKGGRLGVGAKIGIVNTDNDFKRYDVTPSGDIYDIEKSNRFDYKENINALYVNYNKQLKGWLFQAGLRMENTHSRGHSTGQKKNGPGYTSYDSTFERDYTNLFPSASFTLNKNPMNQWTFSFSRRIDRPAYQDLNPFEFKLNEYTYMKGNTELKPQYTNSIGVTNIFKYKLTTSLNYSHVKDIFAQIPDTVAGEPSKGFLTKRNLAEQDVIAMNISYPFQKEWYGFFATFNANYSRYQADFGGEGRKIDQDIFSFTYYMQNTFKLGKGWTGELSGLYISKSVWQGLIRSNAMGTVDAGFQKQILKGAGNVKVSVADIFQTMQWGGHTDFTGVQSKISGHGEMPQLKIFFSYRFGNSQVKGARQRKSAIEEENKRTESGGGMGQQ